MKDVSSKSTDTKFNKEVRDFYTSKQWRKIRVLAYEKYGMLCAYCIEYGEERPSLATTIHHVVEVRKDWSRRFDLDNLRPICNACHNRVHSDIKGSHVHKTKAKKKYAVII